MTPGRRNVALGPFDIASEAPSESFSELRLPLNLRWLLHGAGVKGPEHLWAIDAAQGIATKTNEVGAQSAAGVGKCLGDDQCLVERAAQCGDSRRLIDGGAQDCEVEAAPAAEVAIEDLSLV